MIEYDSLSFVMVDERNAPKTQIHKSQLCNYLIRYAIMCICVFDTIHFVYLIYPLTPLTKYIYESQNHDLCAHTE